MSEQNGFWTLYEFNPSNAKMPQLVVEAKNNCMGWDLYDCAASCSIWPFDSIDDFQNRYDVEGGSESIAIMNKREEDPEFIWEFSKENRHPELEPFWAMMKRVWG